jgi:recombination protein RecT
MTTQGNGSNGSNNGNALASAGSGQVVPLKAKVNTMRALLDQMKDQFKSALPAHFDVGRFMRMALTACQKNTDLLECDQKSFLGAMIECAQLGLEPNTTLGHAYIVPFWNGRNQRQEAQLIPGYKGLVKLAYQSGMVDGFRAHAVHAKDYFEYEYGLNERLIHRPHREGTPGDMVAAYAVAKIKGVDVSTFWVLEKWECEKIRDEFSQGYQRARNKSNNPWVRNFEEMSMKSAARRLAKWLPSDTEKTLLQRALDLDERAEAGIEQEFENVIDISPDAIKEAEAEASGEGQAPATPPAKQEEPKSRLDQLTQAKSEKVK